MAYMPQTKKQLIAAALKQIIPAGWKWSLAVQHHSTLALTISSAPVDLLGEITRLTRQPAGSYWKVNEYSLPRQFDNTLALMQQILAAMNDGNHDRSDIQSDYFDVGWYVSLGVGRWDKPFVCTAPASPAAAIAQACVARGLSADRLIVSVVR